MPTELSEDAGEFVRGELFSAVAPVTAEWLAGVGAVLDGAGPWRPTRGGPRDPGRTKVAGTADALVAWFKGWERKRDGMWFFSDEPRLVSGRIDAYDREPTAGRRVRQHLELDVRDPLLVDDGALDRFAELFAALCEAADAYLGWATHTPILRQRVDLAMAARRTGSIVRRPVDSTYHELNHVLPDVHWLDYLGPAYVERWGARLEKVGVRRRRTRNGGLLLWSTPTPYVLDESVTRIDGYAWKRPYYEALGDAFVHEGFCEGERGEHVPTYDDHRALLTRCDWPADLR